MNCPNCGKEFDPSQKFCEYCGTDLSAAKAAAGIGEENSAGSKVPNNGSGSQSGGPSADQKPASVMCWVAYITLIGFIIAIVSDDYKNGDPHVRFHVNQSLVLILFSLLSVIPIVGYIWGVVMFVFWILDLVNAVQGIDKPTPLLGGIHILN